jgi:hypothetical protein
MVPATRPHKIDQYSFVGGAAIGSEAVDFGTQLAYGPKNSEIQYMVRRPFSYELSREWVWYWTPRVGGAYGVMDMSGESLEYQGLILGVSASIGYRPDGRGDEQKHYLMELGLQQPISNRIAEIPPQLTLTVGARIIEDFL